MLNQNHSKKTRGQISVEYLIIIGISFAILLPAGYFFYGYSQTSNDASIRSQITQIGNSIITNAESIYGLSEGSIVTLDVRYPKNVRDVYVLGKRELVIKYELANGMNEAVFFSKIDLSGNYDYAQPRNTCTLPCTDSAITNTATNPGNHQLKFQSKASYVLITQAR